MLAFQCNINCFFTLTPLISVTLVFQYNINTKVSFVKLLISFIYILAFLDLVKQYRIILILKQREYFGSNDWLEIWNYIFSWKKKNKGYIFIVVGKEPGTWVKKTHDQQE